MISKIARDRPILRPAKDAASRRCCALIAAMRVDRPIAPRSKLGFVRAVNAATAAASLGLVLDLGEVKERAPYAALDRLVARRTRIANGLAPSQGPVLYDVRCASFAGRRCPLARFGHGRDRRKDRPRIVWGLLGTRDGIAIAVEVFDGNPADPSTPRSKDRKAQGSLRDRPRGGRRSRDDHRGTPPRRLKARGIGLDHLPAGTGHFGPGGFERAVAAAVVRRVKVWI